jgi:hypothetical protein
MAPAVAVGIKKSHETMAELVECRGNKPDYLAWLPRTIQHLHKCGAVYCETVPLTEEYHREILWIGDVAVFDPTENPKTKRCSGWTHGAPEQFRTILEFRPLPMPKVREGQARRIKLKRLEYDEHYDMEHPKRPNFDKALVGLDLVADYLCYRLLYFFPKEKMKL